MTARLALLLALPAALSPAVPVPAPGMQTALPCTVSTLPLARTTGRPGPSPDEPGPQQSESALRNDLREAERLQRSEKPEAAAVLARKVRRGAALLDDDRARHNLERDVDRLLDKVDRLDRRRRRELREAGQRILTVAKGYQQRQWFRMAERLVDLAETLDTRSAAKERERLTAAIAAAQRDVELPGFAALFAKDALRGGEGAWEREGTLWLTPAEAGAEREPLALRDLTLLQAERWVQGPLMVELEGRRVGAEGEARFGVVVGRQDDAHGLVAWIRQTDTRASFEVARSTPRGLQRLSALSLALRPDEQGRPLRMILTLADKAVVLRCQDLAPRRIPLPDLDPAGRVGLCQLPGATARARIEALRLSRPE